MKISVCMIVKDEEEVLARCLDGVSRFADEIVIVDTGSTDRTVDIARQYTPNVFFFAWKDDFAVARNFSVSKTTGEYCMWLDADDTIEEIEAEKILRLKETTSPADTYMFLYRSGDIVYYRERLMKRDERLIFQGRVHEAVSPFGRVEYTDITVRHGKKPQAYSTRNLDIYRKMQAEGETFSPRDEFYFGRELYYHREFSSAEKRLRAVAENKDAWVENRLSALSCLAECYLAQGEREKAKQTLLQSLLLSSPRAEILSRLAFLYTEEENWAQAAFWYKACLNCRKEPQNGGFCAEDCYGYIPLMQLCLCSSRLGDDAAAEKYNLLAGKIKPDDPAYRYNLAYFASLKK